ncbi:MAG: hypothetical protein ACU85V_15580 [Gammaproteobacteria bacterium]
MPRLRLLFALAALVHAAAAPAVQVISDGSDGAFNPLASTVIDLPDDGVLNYTSIDIPDGVRVIFRRNAANTPVFLAATGDVSIAGRIDVSAAVRAPATAVSAATAASALPAAAAAARASASASSPAEPAVAAAAR